MSKVKTYTSKFLFVLRALFLLAVLAVLLWLMYIYAGKLLCHIALGQIGEFTNTKINAGSIKYRTDCSVVIDDLIVKPLKSQDSDSEIIRAKKVFARFNKKSLLSLRPRLEDIDVNDFVFNAVYDTDTGWSNLSDLKIKSSGGSFRKAPDINLESGYLQYIKIVNGQKEIALSMPVKADFKSNEEQPQKYNFNITTATMSSGYGQSQLHGSWEPGVVTITGGLASLSLPEFEMAWFINVSAVEMKYDKDKNYSLSLRVRDMQSLRSNEPNVLALEIPSFIKKYGFLTSFQGFFDTFNPKGLLDINIDMSGNLSRLAESNIKGDVICKDVSFIYSEFPYVIDHLAGKIDFTENSISFSNLKGTHRDSELLFSGWYKDYGSNYEYKFNIASDNIPLDNDLSKALSKDEREFLSLFSPEGNINLDFDFQRTLETGWDMDLKVGLLDVKALYKYFPYPLTSLNGRLVFTRDKIKIQNVVSHDSDIEITLNGEILDSKDDVSAYSLAIDVNNVPLNSTLGNALGGKQKKMYQKLNPVGMANGLILVSRQEYNDMKYIADLNFKETSIQMDFLSKPLTDISAIAVLTADQINIKNFSGKYGDIPVTLSGQIMSDQEQQLCYDIMLNMEKVQLDNRELTGLFPDSIRNAIQSIAPDGDVDLKVNLRKVDYTKPMDYSAIVHYLGNSVKIAGFPYDITNVTGLMKVNSDKIELENISAFLDSDNIEDPNNSRITLNGDIKLADDKLKQASLDISANNILMDEKFEGMLPEYCHGLFQTLSPTGSVNIKFNEFRLVKDSGPAEVEFKGAIAMGGCDFVLSNQPAKLDSELLVQGKYLSGSGFENCTIEFNDGTLVALGKTVTALKMNIVYDPNNQKWLSNNILADIYEGKTTGTFELIQKDGVPMEYVLQTAFDNVDLKKFLTDSKSPETQNNTYATGKMNGSMSIYSQIPQNKTLIGSCRVSIKDMQVGKLSPLARLLQVLNLNEPSDYAFDSIFIDSYIKRNALVVDKLDMSGKSVAFYGDGSINLLNGGVDLSLTARGRRSATDDPSVLASLTEGLGQAVVRMYVTGDFNNMKVETRALPVIGGTLEILGTKPLGTN
jgi:hypothetical protein